MKPSVCKVLLHFLIVARYPIIIIQCNVIVDIPYIMNDRFISAAIFLSSITTSIRHGVWTVSSIFHDLAEKLDFPSSRLNLRDRCDIAKEIERISIFYSLLDLLQVLQRSFPGCSTEVYPQNLNLNRAEPRLEHLIGTCLSLRCTYTSVRKTRSAFLFLALSLPISKPQNMALSKSSVTVVGLHHISVTIIQRRAKTATGPENFPASQLSVQIIERAGSDGPFACSFAPLVNVLPPMYVDTSVTRPGRW